MLADIHEGQSDEYEARVAMAGIHVIAVRDRILALRAAAVRIQFFEAFRISWDRRKQSQIGLGFDVQGVPHLLLPGGAVLLKGALLRVKDPLLFSIFAGAGTGEDVGGFGGIVALLPHATAAGTQGRAIELEGGVRIHLDLWARGDRRFLLLRVCCRGRL